MCGEARKDVRLSSVMIDHQFICHCLESDALLMMASLWVEKRSLPNPSADHCG